MVKIMANMKKPLCSVLDEIRTELSSEPDNCDRNYRAALFLSVVCHFNEKRNRGKISDDEVQKGFEEYRSTVSGPCYELFKRILGEESDIPKDRVFPKDVMRLAENNFYKFFGDGKCLYDNGIIASSSKHVDYDELRNYIEKTTWNFPKVVIPKELIISCCEDLISRVPKYNKTQNKSGTKKYHSERAKGFYTKEEEQAARDGNAPQTKMAFAIASNHCRSAIDTLNNEYKTCDDETREKLEKILIPVFSNSPYFSLCIAHKNMLPEALLKLSESDQIFVFVIVVITHDILKTSDRELYVRSQKIVSQSLIDSLKKYDLNSFNADIDKYIVENYYCRKTKEQENGKPKIKYIFAADNYDFMLEKYRKFCSKWKYTIVNSVSSNNWFPLELPEKLYDSLKSLFIKTDDYSLELLLKEQEEKAINLTSKSDDAVSAYEGNTMNFRAAIPAKKEKKSNEKER